MVFIGQLYWLEKDTKEKRMNEQTLSLVLKLAG